MELNYKFIILLFYPYQTIRSQKKKKNHSITNLLPFHPTKVSNCRLYHMMWPQYCGYSYRHNRITLQLRYDTHSHKVTVSKVAIDRNELNFKLQT